MKEFCNVKNIFVCKITPRCDRHVINSKFSEYNKLLDEHFSNQDSLTVLPTIQLEASLLYKDNLHLSAKGLCQVSGIILSNLYQVLAPNSDKPGLRRESKSGRNAKSSNKAKNRKYWHHAISSSALNLGCWNLKYFRTARLHFTSLINCFDIFAICEHCLFEEQLEMLESSTNYVYKSIAVSADDNSHILSGSIAHGGIALLWKRTIHDFVTPLENIESDRIVGIRCDFDNCDPLFILSVYLPSSNSTIDEFKEYLNFLWALYDSLSDKGHVLVSGDFNGDLGDSLGHKRKYPPNQRGSKLLDFANFCKLCPANILNNCDGPLETYISGCGRHRSTLEYIFVPNCLLGNIISCKTFDMQIETTSDHIPITLELNYPTSSVDIITDDFASDMASNPKINWSKFSQEENGEKYITPLVNQLENINMAEYLDSSASAETVTNLLLQNSVSLAKKNCKTNKKNKSFVRLPEEFKVARYHGKVAFDDWKQLNFPFEGDAQDIYRAKRKDIVPN